MSNNNKIIENKVCGMIMNMSDDDKKQFRESLNSSHKVIDEFIKEFNNDSKKLKGGSNASWEIYR